MIAFNQKYQGIDNFEKLLEDHRFVKSDPCLVKIFTAGMKQKEAVNTAVQIKAILPNAEIVGSTAAGIILDGKQYENETMILVEKYEKLKIKVCCFSWDQKSARVLAEEIYRAFPNPNQETVHILFSDRYYDVNAFVDEINRLTPRIRLAGGIAGDLLQTNTPGYVFTERGVITNGALVFAVTGDSAVCFMDVNTAQEPISPVFTVTGTRGSLIETIEGEPADQWMYRYLALDEMRSFGDWKSIADNDHLIRFQMILEGHGTAGRFVRYDEEEKSLSLYFSQIAPGTKFQIGYTNSSKCIRDCYALCQKIMECPVENIFVYTCLFRKLYMSNSSRWELQPLAEYNVCGVFMMGEIGFINGQNEFYNGSCLVTGIAENRRFIMPDMSALDNFTQIEDDAVMTQFAMMRQKEAMGEGSSNLMTELKNQRHETEEHMYVDMRLHIPNVLRYKQDKRKYKFNKLCMAQVENDDLLISYAGLDRYLDIMREMLNKMKEFLKNIGVEEEIFLYCVTQNIFFFAGKEELPGAHFENGMRALFEQFHYYKSEKTGLAQMVRFVLVLEQDDMLQGGLNALQATKDIQSHFIVCDEKSSLTLSYAEELRVIELLNAAICSDGVIPYYQGIRNNKTGETDQYEALMRLRGVDGEMNCPAVFLDISKKYHLYSTLSQMMIGKVLQDFKERKEAISINLSKHDIESEEFVTWFFEKLKGFSNVGRLTVEFVETEDCGNSSKLAAFVERLRAVGGKISVDDFGTGYSSLAEVIDLEPDYIKVDGSIICDLDCRPKNMILLKTIIFLARQLHIQIVAEFVENEKIQELVEANAVDYSQGYLFSVPQPLNVIAQDECASGKNGIVMEKV